MCAIAAALLATLALVSAARATPDFLDHQAAAQVYGEPAGVTMREPDAPAPGAAVDVWLRIGYSFYYDNVALYYTTDGSTPQGAFGVGSGTTATLTFSGGSFSFIRNEPHSPANIDWWRATLPAAVQVAGRTVKYRLSAWHSGGGAEVFANNAGCADGTCDNPAAPPTTFEYTVSGGSGGGAVPWPGKGAPYADHDIGYPPVYFWKEEAVVGNGYMNVQLDQNGTIYDVYYPSAGCVRGMGTKNEGYVDGLDTFPPGLPPGARGQMNLNQAMAGIRVDGVTYWLSNEAASGYNTVVQWYSEDTNTVHTTATLIGGGNSISVIQDEFCAAGITFPNDLGGQPNRAVYLKRFLLNNHGPTKTVQFYFYMDPALNGGDSYDVMFADATRGAMCAYDNTQRWTSASGEYNPTTTGDYNKDVSIYLAAALRVCPDGIGCTGTPATDNWRLHGSTDSSQGWIGLEVTLPTDSMRQVDLALVGGFDNFAGATGTYDWQIAPVLDWFLATSVGGVKSATDQYWNDWLDAGVRISTPDPEVNRAFTRGLLATALHLDGKNGGVVAGMHNGAYPFVWPRDAVWAAITLDRTGHTAEAAEVYRFLRDVAYRADDSWGKGFWYQKYTTDGHIVWNSPQVDETSAVPWGAYQHYLTTGDSAFLTQNYQIIYEAARASSEDSTIDGRLYYDDPYQLMHSNNLWEDAWDDFIYSNASVERGLRDAAAIATVLGHTSDASLFTSRANAIHSGITARLAWDGENTDISLLGPAYPFNVYGVTDPLITHCVDRMNGVATNTFGQNRPIMNFSGEWTGLLNRYWADTYWNGGPWFLSTLWYGCYYAQRQDVNAGKADIDNHLDRLTRCLDRLGPAGLGAEQIAPSNSLMYPDFVLQAAWPNAWESMSFLVDAILLFVDAEPDAPANTLRVAPKLPTGWSELLAERLPVGPHRITLWVGEDDEEITHRFTNLTGAAVSFDTYLRVPGGCDQLVVTRDGAPVSYTYDAGTGRVRVTGPLNTGVSAETVVRVDLCGPADVNCDCHVALDDFNAATACMAGPDNFAPGGCDPGTFDRADVDDDNDVDLVDLALLQELFTGP